ncbi:uncharacterized protein [Amphiura filiformis]|uniref:uncharacterized protein n=1 Tax=Amphiura filiformis TaxID=82378 RepID=UPI003B21B600
MAAGGSKSVAKRTKSFDVYIPLKKGSSQHVHLQILQGDIIKENTQAMAVFRSDTDIAEGDSLRILQAAGDGIKAEYQRAKTRGGRHVAKGVVLTGAGDLKHLQHILHLLVNQNGVKLRIALATALQMTEKQYSRSITFPHIPAIFSSVETVKTMLESFDDFTRVDCPMCLHFIQVVLANDDGFYQYADARQIEEFEMYKHLLIKKGPRDVPSNLTVLQEDVQQDVQPLSVRISSHRQLTHFYPARFAREIHATLGQVHLHVQTTGHHHHAHQNVNVAFVDFRHANKTNHSDNKVLYHPRRFSEIEASPLTDDISIKTAGNQSLFEITIDDEPGKFPRIRSAIHRVLQYADQKGIKYISFPSEFDYGDDQIEHWYQHQYGVTLESPSHFSWSPMADDDDDDAYPPAYYLFPLLYFNAIYDFAIYDQPSTQLNINILTSSHSDLAPYMDVWHWALPSTHGKESILESESSFHDLFTQLDIDTLFTACHLSVVKETYTVIRHRWTWEEFLTKRFSLHTEKATDLDRFTYGRALQQIASIQIPSDIFYTESSPSDNGHPSSSDGSDGSRREYKDYINTESYINRYSSSYTKSVVRFDNTPPPPPKPLSGRNESVLNLEQLWLEDRPDRVYWCPSIFSENE